METNTQILDPRIKNNAMSAYFMIFLCAAFLIAKDEEYIKHPFVKAHTKTALFLHTIIALICVVFIWYGIGGSISYNGFHLNFILASSLLLGVFGLLLYGAYKAFHGQGFIISDIAQITKTEKIIDLNHDTSLDEKDKLTLILSMLPFIGYLIYGKYSENDMIKNTVKLNIYVTLFISILGLSGYDNTMYLFGLFYIIYIVFSSIQIIVKNELLLINLEKIPSFSRLYDDIKIGILYIISYFKKFQTFETIKKDFIEQQQEETKKQGTSLKNKERAKLPSALIYTPFINLISLYWLDSKQYIHIKNGFGITIAALFSLFFVFSHGYFLFLFIFPVLIGIGFLGISTYKLPLFYDLGHMGIQGVSKIYHLFYKAKEIKNTETKLTYTVSDIKNPL